MPDDYSSTGGGLKLKGAGAGISKKKKKKKKNTATATATATTNTPPSTTTPETALQKALKDEDTLATKNGSEATRKGDTTDNGAPGGTSEEQLKELESRDQSGKTASERAHEEMRRRRLNDRLKREGVKTHKERVEELNRYLSTLSEHHDMPRIGPG